MQDDPDLLVLERLWSTHGSGGPVRYTRLSGRSRRVYLCEPASGLGLVIRLAADERARFPVEAEVVQRLGHLDVPIPELRFVGEVETDSGTVAAMVQERAAGRTLRAFADASDRADAHAATARAGEVLRRVHQVRTERFGPLGLGLRGTDDSFGAWFVDAVEPKAAQAVAIAPESAASVKGAMDLLAAHRAMLDEAFDEVLDASAPCLVHGDFSPDNILVDEHGRVSAILDWEAVKSGPPELDIGWWDCFFEAPATPVVELLRGYADPAFAVSDQLRAIRHLTVLRVMIGHLSWSASIGATDGAAVAGQRLARELETAETWRAV